MTEIETLRHSCAHVLATAILRIWPEAQFAAGPPVENGFYYDVDLSHRITPEDFPRIEEEMKKEIKANHRFEKVEVSREQAIQDWRESGALAALARTRPATQQVQARYHPEHSRRRGDLPLPQRRFHRSLRRAARDAHRQHRRLQAHHVASAYYKGDETNPQLQRIYGTAFKNKTELEAYFKMLEEAKKRDHRKIGREMELFCFDDDCAVPACRSGCPRAPS